MKRQCGFTLIELLVVVAVVAILAAIAIPQYSDYVMRSKLAEATSTLSEHRVKMEQYFQDNRTYVGACTAGTVAPPPTGRYFTYNCGTPTATTFTITATGVASQGTAGFVFTLNQANARATTGVPTGWTTNGTCWVSNKGGVC
jgi:type IV pilus assembly protein PilE